MNNLIHCALVLALSASAPVSGAAASGAARPNVVLVVTDDQGYGDLSCLGNPVVRTPAIDRLHGESVRLSDYHVAPTCAPTRAALLSGHWSNRTGVWHTILGRSLLRPESPTMGEVFAAAGYATGLFGKWHLGDNFPFRPEDRGFHEVVRHGSGGVGQTPDPWDNAYFDDTYFHNGVPRRFDGYCTDVFFREARRFIGTSVDAGKPFFAYVSTNAPHSPFHADDRHRAPYRNRGLSEEEEVFFAMIANLDENVGALRGWLAERGLAENTIFIFTTDNGTASGERVFNAGMRGKKASAYDGGHRVPFFLHWPGGGLDVSRDIDALTAHVDILPTLADLCGLTLPRGYAGDGRSLVPLLFQLPNAWPDRVMITDSQRVLDPIQWRQSSTMTSRWRLIDGRELYDIKADPGQAEDVAARHPAVVARLRAAYEEWWRDLEPGFARAQRIVVGHPAANPVDLNAHDWLTEAPVTPWNQAMIRRGDAITGHWALAAAEPGTYRFELRRWPAEVGAAITAALPPGKPVPGLVAFRETPGVALPVVRARIEAGGRLREQPVAGDVEHVVFTLDLPAGPFDLQAEFLAADGRVWGAYYLRVTRLEPR